eukprot:scaffold39524_cov62-Cyclotella_meneghiniana.AAC.2
MRPLTSPMKQLLYKIQTDEWKKNALQQNIGLSDIETLLKPTAARTKTKAKQNKAPSRHDNGKRSDFEPRMAKREPFDQPSSISKAKRSLMQDPANVSSPIAKFGSLKLFERTAENKRRKLISEPIKEMQSMYVTRSSGKKLKLG